MTDGSWFRERADAELGATPPVPDDRLDAVLARAESHARRRLAELASAAGVVLVSLALVALTIVVSRGGPTTKTGAGDGAGVPAYPTGELLPAAEASGTPAQTSRARSAGTSSTPAGATQPATGPGGQPGGYPGGGGQPTSTSTGGTPAATRTTAGVPPTTRRTTTAPPTRTTTATTPPPPTTPPATTTPPPPPPTTAST